jgi:glycosyltransferase involved in cell wall biosynthesis
VHFTGSVPYGDVPAVYAATDIAVLPTFREGLSQVSLEAGAAGVALVSTRVSGMDAVEDGVTGLLVPPGQAAPLSEAILRLASKAALRQRLGAAARARIESCYSDQRVNRLWMMEYLRLADMSPRPWVEVRAAR